MITILADESSSQIGRQLYHILNAAEEQAAYIALEHVDIKPCISCRGCLTQTYGKCVVRDDGDVIYPQILQSDVLVLVSPLTFGGYSFSMKRVIDKFGLLMDEHYDVVDKELTKKGKRGRQFKLFCIAYSAQHDQEEANTFRTLVRETLWITKGSGKAYVTGVAVDGETLQSIAEEVRKA